MEFFKKIKLFFKAFYKVPLLIPSWDEKELADSLNNNPKDRDNLRNKIKELYGVKYAFDFNLGRCAMQIALRSFGLRKGDEVILSTYSCRGVIEPIIREGLKPVLVDIDNHFNISPESIEKNITKRTKVIIMGHLYGYPAQIDKILTVKKKYKLYLIDDAAQVVGLRYNNKMVGTFGDAGILSFGIGKSISATGGGMLITNNKNIADVTNLNWLFSKEDTEDRSKDYWLEYYQRSKTAPFLLLANKFIKKEDWIIKRMSLIDCSLILKQLIKLQGLISFRRITALTYHKCLDGNTSIEIPDVTDKSHIFTKYVIKLKPFEGNSREFSRFLRMNRIETEVNYQPLHLYSRYRKFKTSSLGDSEKIWEKVITIPCHHRMTYQNKLYVVKKINECFK